MNIDLKGARYDKRMTQTELSEKSGVSRATIVAIEKNPDYNPKIKVLESLANALEVPLSRLFLP